MQQFIEKYRDQITGLLSGFDRLVLRGSLRRLNFGKFDSNLKTFVAKGMEEYCWQNKLLFKNYSQHVKAVSERLKKASLQPFQQQGLPVLFVQSPLVNKDQLARGVAESRKITSGLVCAISALEPSPTFEHKGIHIIRRVRPSHVLYHYQLHPEVGWMYARIQTWFPFNIQIGLNGHEWLARQMDNEGLKYVQQGNCFPWIEDLERAQQLMNRQLETHWAKLLGDLSEQLNPIEDQIFAKYPTSYYWTCHQSEWATDIIFRDADFLKRLMPRWMQHAILDFSSTDVLRYYGRRVNRSGQIPANFNGVVQIDLKKYREGQRVKYALDGNTAKFYDKAYSTIGSVLRGAETTINNVKGFKVYRPKEGGSAEDLQWLDLRKGMADVHRRVQVSQNANNRLLNALASVDDSRTVEELTTAIQQPAKLGDRRVRALRPWADDKQLLTAVNHGDFLPNGFRNRDLQALLYAKPAESDIEKRRRSAAVSRKLRMLRAHGVIEKVSCTHRYHVKSAARTMLIAIFTAARTSLNQLDQLQGKAA
jgi:hypothetical protein